MTSPILRGTTSLLAVLLVLFSLFLFLRGHNQPGGGFVGGLVVATAYALHLLAFGPAPTRSLLPVRPETAIGLGIVASLLAGILGWVVRGSFLASLWLPDPIPGIGKVGSVLLFDLGVYLVVFGVVIGILLRLFEETTPGVEEDPR